MSPELETLDQLSGGDLSVSVIRSLLPNEDQFLRAIEAMLAAGEIRLTTADNTVVPKWQRRETLLSATDFTRVSITELGGRRIG